MAARVFVVDTNVVVAGLLTRDSSSPTVKVLEGMVEARFPFLLSTALLAEYRAVLLRPQIRTRHGLDKDEIDALLAEIATHAIVRHPEGSALKAPAKNDQHLWDLLATEHGSVLITGDKGFLESPPKGAQVMSPAGVAW